MSEFTTKEDYETVKAYVGCPIVRGVLDIDFEAELWEVPAKMCVLKWFKRNGIPEARG